MIQRIQTIYLSVAVIASALLFFLPLASFYNEVVGNYRLFIYSVKCMDPNPKFIFGNFYTFPLLFFMVTSVFLSAGAIFLYKKRLLQARYCTFNIMINIVFLMVLFFFYINQIKGMVKIEPEYNPVGMILPLVTMASLILASRAIRKDEELVKSADRLR